MKLQQKTELRKLLVPELRQSLEVLIMPVLELSTFIEQELLSNPVLETESAPEQTTPAETAQRDDFSDNPLPSALSPAENNPQEKELQITRRLSLQEVLLRQLLISTPSEEHTRIGMEIIGNIDDNGYLQAGIEEISEQTGSSTQKCEETLKLIQSFEPAGVGARSVKECLIIQYHLSNSANPLLLDIIDNHLEDIARKKYDYLAKKFQVKPEVISEMVKRISQMNPKPGRNYSNEEVQRVIPDVTLETDDNEETPSIKIQINKEYIPRLSVNPKYRELLKTPTLDQQTREYLENKIKNARELIRAVSKRQDTLKRVANVIAEIQKEAIQNDFSCLKPLTFKEVAQKLELHETTICRVVMHKYAKTPHGIIALKDFFPSKITDSTGNDVSSTSIKGLIMELISQEDKNRPLSDQEIAQHLNQDKKLNVARRTINKYRKQLKILPAAYRKEK